MHKTASDTDVIFRHAATLADERVRQQFLDESCKDDFALRAQLNQRLEAHFRNGKTLEETTDGFALGAAPTSVPKIGSRIGPYQLLEEIGEGGMGIVFLAQQTEPMRRRVALKVIKVGMDTRRVVARFEAEQQTMALLDHPCITKVLDAGATDAGRPYFVMEWVQGKPITKFCDEHRFSVRRRLDVVIQLCSALEHAHQKGIIHRDIKPTNVLVTELDGLPLPKIIDFGIAKAVASRSSDESAVTRLGEMVGTPLYMSPEQADTSEADVDTRSDIYSLGVLLYELVTGTTPFCDLKKSSIADIRAAIRTQDPPTASSRVNSLRDTVITISNNRGTDARSLYRSIRGELDWILTKCLARDRDQRYQSAGDLAREIQRFIDGDALDAAAPTIWYRTKKFVKRNRAAVGLTTLAACVLAFVTVFSSWMAVQANALAERATNAEKLANSRLTDTIAQRDRAVAAEKRLAQLEREQRNRVAIHQAAARHNADMVKKFFEKSPSNDQDANQPGMLSMPLSTLLDAPGSRSRPPALPVDQAFNIQRAPTAVAANALPPNTGSILGTMCDRDDLEVFVCDDQDECEASVLKSILEQQKAAFGSDDVMVAATLNKLGEFMSQRERWNESAEYFDEAVEILKDTAQEHPELLKIRENLANVINNRGNVAAAVSELQAAKKAIGDLDIQRDLRQIMGKIISGWEQKQHTESDDAK